MRELAKLLRGSQLKPVYHGEHGLRTLKELGRSYDRNPGADIVQYRLQRRGVERIMFRF